MLKICTKCKEEKDIAEFGKRSDAPDGLMYRCNKCIKEHNDIWRFNNTEKNRARKKDWYYNNPEKVKNWYLKNIIKVKERQDLWRFNNPGKVNAKAARRRAVKKQAMPAWLSAIERAQIQEFYEIAIAKTVQTGMQYEVDHIHPLIGSNFNGLHVPWNLEVIKMKENRSKGNRAPKIGNCLFW